MSPVLRGILVACICIVVSGCIFTPSKEDPPPPKDEYRTLTSPANLVWNLQVAYIRREIEKYAEIMAPEFIFRFQLQDAQDPDIDSEFWTFEEDSVGTEALFQSTLVTEIRIDLPHPPAEPSTEIGLENTMKVRVNPTSLDVDQSDGITWRVDGDIQDMFFRKGMVEAGEDTTRWFLVEWRDIPGGGGVGAPRSDLETLSQGDEPADRTQSWGRLRREYLRETEP